MPIIYKIAVTGGPCGGKTSFMEEALHYLLATGVDCIVVPEAATQIISEWNESPQGLSPEQYRVFQWDVANRVRILEVRAYEEALRSSFDTVVILCDRGLLDARAYMEDHEFRAVMKEMGTSLEEVLLTRYDGAIHMQTAAQGAEEFYTLENNESRKETPEQARALDHKTLQAWAGAYKLSVIPNTSGGTFQDKIDHAISVVDQIIGRETSYEVERKWTVVDQDLSHIFGPALRIHQTYLKGHKDERVRVIQLGEVELIVHTLKVEHDGEGVIEIERKITRDEYQSLLASRGVSGVPIIKKRTVFAYENQIYELDQFLGEYRGISVLELEVPSLGERFSLPSIALGREVTGNPEFSNKNMASAA